MATTDPMAAVRQYVDAFNKGDGEAMAATFAVPGGGLVAGTESCLGRPVVRRAFHGATGDPLLLRATCQTIIGGRRFRRRNARDRLDHHWPAGVQAGCVAVADRRLRREMDDNAPAAGPCRRCPARRRAIAGTQSRTESRTDGIGTAHRRATPA